MGDTVLVNYTGYTLDGKVFDSSIAADAQKAGLNQPGRNYELDETLAILNRKDGDVAQQRADRIKIGLKELTDPNGRDKDIIEADFRSMIWKSSSQQMSVMEQSGAIDAILNS